MKSFFTKTKRTVAAGLVLLCFALAFFGCIHFHSDSKEYDPFPGEFEETKLICRELDMTFYVFNYNYVNATYTLDGTTYYGNVSFYNRSLFFALSFYASDSESSRLGTMHAAYHYDEKTDTVVLSHVRFREKGSETDSETFPENLTLERAGSIAQTPTARLSAEEIEMTLDSFSDIDGFYKGEVSFDGIRVPLIAVKDYETGRYVFHLEVVECDEIRWDRFRFPPMTFETFDGRIVATVKGGTDLEYYRVWFQYYRDIETITFRPVPIETE